MFSTKREDEIITQPVRIIEENDEEILVGEKPEINGASIEHNENLKNGQKTVIYLQIFIILLLLLNIATMIGWFEAEEPRISWDIELTKVSEEYYGSIYQGEINLNNYGGKTTWINVWGEVYKSNDDSDPGEEMVKVLNGLSSEITPNQKIDIDLGTFTVDNDFIYSVRVYIHWSSGSFRWAKIIIPED